MAMLLLYSAACIMILPPICTAAMLALFPGEFRMIPLWLWVVWFLLSVWVALDASVRVERLIPPIVSTAHGAMRDGERP